MLCIVYKSEDLSELRDKNKCKRSHNRKRGNYNYNNDNGVTSAAKRINIFALDLAADKAFAALDSFLILGRLKNGIIVAKAVTRGGSPLAAYVTFTVAIVVVFVAVCLSILTANIADSIAGVIVFMALYVSFKSALIAFAVAFAVVYVAAHRASRTAEVTFTIAAVIKAMRHVRCKLITAKIARFVTFG